MSDRTKVEISRVLFDAQDDIDRRRAYFDGWLDCPLYARERLSHGHRLRGPAIIEQVDSTIVLHPRQEAHVDRFGNVIIEVGR